MVDASLIIEVVEFVQDNESKMDKDLGRVLASGHFSEPLLEGEIIAPTKRCEDPSGVILRNGRIIAQWGQVDRADLTFSVTKSYLALCAGIAVDEGLISDLDQRVGELVKNGNFESEQNREITWSSEQLIEKRDTS